MEPGELVAQNPAAMNSCDDANEFFVSKGHPEFRIKLGFIIITILRAIGERRSDPGLPPHSRDEVQRDGHR